MVNLNWANWSKYVAVAVSRKVARLEAVGALNLDAIDREEFQAECAQRAGLIAHELASQLAEHEVEAEEREIVSMAISKAVRLVRHGHWIGSRPIKTSRVKLAANSASVLSAQGDRDYSEAQYESFAEAMGSWIEDRREDNGLGWSIWVMKERGAQVFEAAHKLGVGKSKAYEALRAFEKSLEEFASDYAKFVL